MGRFVCCRLLDSISLKIQTVFQASRPIMPFQIIIDVRVNKLDTLRPKEISSLYKRGAFFTTLTSKMNCDYEIEIHASL